MTNPSSAAVRVGIGALMMRFVSDSEPIFPGVNSNGCSTEIAPAQAGVSGTAATSGGRGECPIARNPGCLQRLRNSVDF